MLKAKVGRKVCCCLKNSLDCLGISAEIKELDKPITRSPVILPLPLSQALRTTK
ncbi:hypothetical protein [Tolypothrix sp. FACHB-123]|uniref:hypothetical protein n=1 Tax=Tolypothrix sp. FACHB-123 TaxID=2692868 RepID=UPI001686CA66|nr:hypothetical protein [Tolypothrix sp. FACHB-123]